MKKINLFPTIFSAARATGLRAWQTGLLFQKVARTTLDTIQDVLRAEIKQGNAQLVADFLADKALPAAKALLLKRMTTRLLMRIGLRGALASSVVGWILPFVLEKMIQVGVKTGFFEKIKNHDTVTNALHRLDELKRAVWKIIAPDAGSSAELLPDGAPVPPALPAPKP